MQRISVVGTTGSGKTTLARTLARRMDVPHIELDALNWEPDWKEAPVETFRERVAQAVAAPSWTCDGNYSKLDGIVWRHADTVLWLDYSLAVNLSRLLRRTARRVFNGEECCNGNREQLTRTLSRDSVLLWFFKTYRCRRRDYPVMLARPEQAHLTIVRLRSPRQADAWLRRLPEP